MTEPRFVYFLRAIGLGLVKIGSSIRPEERLMDYAIWSPVPLELVATLTGDRRLEACFHTMFMGDHSHSEWFRGSVRMDAVIRAIRAGTFDVASLPDPILQQPALTEIGRQNRGLRARLTRRFSDERYRLPDAVQQHYDALSLPAGPARDEAVMAVLRLLNDAERAVA